MSYTPQQVLTALRKKQYAPVYFLQGNEPYYIDLITNYIEHHVLDASERDFNLTVLYGKEQTMREVLGCARRFPMGSTRQVVIVKEAQALQDFNTKEGTRLLEAYVQAPQRATLLVWAYPHKMLDARSSLYKLLQQHAVLVTAKKIYDHQVSPWIHAYVQEQGRSITGQAVALLQACVGNDLPCLSNELDKIGINLAQDALIDEDAVHTYVGISKVFNAFSLQKALAKRDKTAVYKMLQHFEKDLKRSQMIPLVALLFTFFSKLLLFHHAQDKSEPVLVKTLQLSPYFVREYLQAAKCYTLSEVVAAIAYLHKADLQLKGIGYPTMAEGQVLKELLPKLFAVPTH